MADSIDNIISALTYTKRIKKIEWNAQVIIKSEHHLNLYNNKITSSESIFALDDVWDVSYKSFSGNLGLLYLHTNQGLFAFEVTSNPDFFIRTFIDMK